MTVNNTLKEYYIKLQDLYNNTVNLLSGIQQSLNTYSSEVSVSVTNGDEESIVRIPSFLYIENKVEQLESNFSNLFSMPDSGEAWFENNSDLFKLKLVTANTAPNPLIVDSSQIYKKSNNIFNELINPLTYMRFNIEGLSKNVDEVYVKKIIFKDSDLYANINTNNLKSYNEIMEYLYSYDEGVDYTVVEQKYDLPFKTKNYNSEFKITYIPTYDELKHQNPWKENEIKNESIYTAHSHLCYKVQLDTLIYYNYEDRSIEYTLKEGDYLALDDNYTLYKVKSVNYDNNEIIMDEYIGHVYLQTYEENSSMTFQIYDKNYSKYNYVDVSIDNNQYIGIFLAASHDKMKSNYSDCQFFNTYELNIKDENGNDLIDENNNVYTFKDYFNKYVYNIGQLLTSLKYYNIPNLEDYSIAKIKSLNDNASLNLLINDTISTDILQVVPINKHLIEDQVSQEIIELHEQKSNINNQLTVINQQINNLYTEILSTETSDTSESKSVLQTKLQTYYNNRTTLQQQLSSIVNSINDKATGVNSITNIKYRIRGVIDYSQVESFIQNILDAKASIINLDVIYKYKSTNSSTNQLTSINSSSFPDWNRMTIHLDKEKILSFGTTITVADADDVKYQWNLVDIPITQGEDVIIKIRFKYNICQPFLNLWTDWSDELQITFPEEYKINDNIMDILEINSQDVISTKFNDTLINDGYQEHISNKLISNEVVYYHQPENIYSGFTTSDNTMISLKDKLYSIDSDINKYKTYIEEVMNSNYKVYLQYNNNLIELFKDTDNNIYINDVYSDVFIRNKMNIVISNISTSSVKLYSIFKGDNTALLANVKDISEFYQGKNINKYNDVPLFVDGQIKPFYQRFNQLLYFSNVNSITGKYIGYYDINKNLFNCTTTLYNQLFNVSKVLGNEGVTSEGFRALLDALQQDMQNNNKYLSNAYSALYNLEVTNSTTSETYSESNDETYYNFIPNINYLYDATGTETIQPNSPLSDVYCYYGDGGALSSFNKRNMFFAYPCLNAITDITIDNDANYKEILAGNNLSIPIWVEYCIADNDQVFNKQIAFDLKDNLDTTNHYIITFNINTNQSFTTTNN